MRGHRPFEAGCRSFAHRKAMLRSRSLIAGIIGLKLSASLIAVILAAGHGTRMRSRIPKVLHPICGRPMVDWVLQAVEEAGAKQVKVIANPHHAELAAHLEGRAEVVYQRDPRGTAHALQQIPAGELRGRQVLIVNGDSALLT